MAEIFGDRFERSFFQRKVQIVARDLLGSYLHRKLGNEEMIGRIVETEAYHQSDPASHSYHGMTERNKIMFGEAGFSYVYFTYGMHYCMNIVTGFPDTGEAILFRALEPVHGTKEMFRRRKKAKTERDLLSGPAKLCEALGIARTENGIDLITGETLYLTRGSLGKDERIGVSTRVGITVGIDKNWRYYIKNNPFVSKGRPSS
ncbi:MAG: DNA-3-methyladenine glycosylase [Bacteroidota bacterium]|nr:DNA-3-methyladenine glycosylase [Bacteroidota bacterium]MDP4235884.1 DNA-3-methyladenine glycosylase [Bacteroidota bacterium]